MCWLCVLCVCVLTGRDAAPEWSSQPAHSPLYPWSSWLHTQRLHFAAESNRDEDEAKWSLLTFTLTHTHTSHRLIGDELCSHGKRNDQDGGWAGPEQHSSPVYLLTHPDVHQHPVGESHDQQQPHEVCELEPITSEDFFTISSFSQCRYNNKLHPV